MQNPADLVSSVLTVSTPAGAAGLQNNQQLLAAPGANKRLRIWWIRITAFIDGAGTIQPANPYTVTLQDFAGLNVGHLGINTTIYADEFYLPGGLPLTANQSLRAYSRSSVAGPKFAVMDVGYTIEDV